MGCQGRMWIMPAIDSAEPCHPQRSYRYPLSSSIKLTLVAQPKQLLVAFSLQYRLGGNVLLCPWGGDSAMIVFPECCIVKPLKVGSEDIGIVFASRTDISRYSGQAPLYVVCWTGRAARETLLCPSRQGMHRLSVMPCGEVAVEFPTWLHLSQQACIRQLCKLEIPHCFFAVTVVLKAGNR